MGMIHTHSQIRTAIRDLPRWTVDDSTNYSQRKGPIIARDDGLFVRVLYEDVAGGPTAGAESRIPTAGAESRIPLHPMSVFGNSVYIEPVYVAVGVHVLFSKKWRQVSMDNIPYTEDFPAIVLHWVDELFPLGAAGMWERSVAVVEGKPSRLGLLLDENSEDDPATSRRLGMLFADG